MGMGKYGKEEMEEKGKRNGRKGIMITITYWEWFSIRDSASAFIFSKSIYIISINIVSKENVYHIFQNMEKHRQYLKIVS